jgi:hypothetical protein
VITPPSPAWEPAVPLRIVVIASPNFTVRPQGYGGVGKMSADLVA